MVKKFISSIINMVFYLESDLKFVYRYWNVLVCEDKECFLKLESCSMRCGWV